MARLHGVLTRYDDGSWTIAPAGGHRIGLNGKPVEIMEELHYGDLLVIGEERLIFESLTHVEQESLRSKRTRAGRDVLPALTLLLVTVFQTFTALQLMATAQPGAAMGIGMAFAVLCGMMWGLFFLMKLIRRHAFEVETIAFFLSTLGLAVIASDDRRS